MLRIVTFFLELIIFRHLVVEGCESNYTDRVVPDNAIKVLKSSGYFPQGGCPLLKPNRTVPARYEKFIFGIKLGKGACISSGHVMGTTPYGRGSTENNRSIEMEINKRRGGFLNRTDYRGRAFFLPYATIDTIINNHRVREIDDKKHTITLDISLTMMWTDFKIFTYQSKYEDENQGLSEIEVPPERANNIWKPEFPIYNLSDYKAFMDSLHVVSLKIFRKNHFANNLCIYGPMLRYEIEAKITFYCDFDFSDYPMDNSSCKFRFGGQKSDLKFILVEPENKSRGIQMYYSSGFDIIVSTAKEEYDVETKNRIGLDISIQRVLQPFILKYYLPCILIVLVSQCSFIIPLEALPGRVVLVVTQLLTLTSLFIHQMVSFKCVNP